MIEIQILGRGGQGVVSAAYLIASSAFKQGLIAQASAEIGIERRGSPVSSFVRISKTPITRYDHIYQPDILVVQDSTLLQTNPEKNLKKNGILIINSKKNPNELNLREDIKVFTINATDLAINIFGKPFFNVPLMAALASITKITSLNSIYEAIEEIWYDKPKEIIEKNKLVSQKAFNMFNKIKCKVKL